MVPFPLLISLNSRMSLEAGGERGGRAPFPWLALPAPAAPAGRTAGCSPWLCHRRARQASSRARTHAVPRKAVALTVVQDHCCWVCKSRRGGHVAGKLALSVAIAGCL